jgi:hypothetical protein
VRIQVAVSVPVGPVVFTGVLVRMTLVVPARHHGAIRHHVRAGGGMVVMGVLVTTTLVTGVGRWHSAFLCQLAVCTLPKASATWLGPRA